MGMNLARALAHQRDHRIKGNAYHLIQCDLAYNSNHIEGSTLTHDQTVQIFERGTVSGYAKVDDVIEARNHFDLVDFVLDEFDEPLDLRFLREMHAILKRGTSAELDPYQVVGDFKAFDNEIAGAVSNVRTAPASEVRKLLGEFLASYEEGRIDIRSESGLARFHWEFERIHPFSDGNGRIGRVLLLKEALRRDVTPPLITDDVRPLYIRALREFEREPGYLEGVMGHGQDVFEARYSGMIEAYVRKVEEIEVAERGRDLDEGSIVSWTEMQPREGLHREPGQDDDR